MGFLRADGQMPPMRLERVVIERRGGSIGTPHFRSQSKRGRVLVFGLVLAISLVAPAGANAAGTELPPDESALPPPPAPPPSMGAPAAGEPLPGAPAPRSVPVAAPAATPARVPNGATAAPPGAPGNDLPPLPRPAHGVHLHDDFYLRMAVGLGIAGAMVSSDSKAIGDYSFGGGAGALDLWIGGTPTPGLAMGAALSVFGLNSSQRRVDGNRLPGDVAGSSGLLGYFIDVFPDPARGLHFGGALGFASGAAEVKESDRKFRGGGLGLEAWGGYEFWISPQWSLGGMLRFMGSVTREEKDGVSYEASLGSATLSFTALYH